MPHTAYQPTLSDYLAAVSYTLSAGATTGMTMGFSLFHRFGSLPWAIAGGLTTGSADALSCLGFQVPAILRIDDHRKATEDESSGLEAHICRKTTAVSAQVVYFGLDVLKAGADRYFLLVATQQLFNIALKPAEFFGILGADVFIRVLFNSTHETFESLQIISHKLGLSMEPFYSNAFRLLICLFGAKATRKVIKILGSFEHSVLDDLYPWILVLDAEKLKWLSALPWLYKAGFITGGSVIGIPLLFLFCLQTGLFEGAHTSTNLSGLIDSAEAERLEKKRVLAHWPKLRKILSHSLYLLGALHGASNGVPVFWLLREWLSNSNLHHQLKFWLPMVGGAVAFLGTSSGSIKSEVREAQEKLADSETPPISIESSDSDSEENQFTPPRQSCFSFWYHKILGDNNPNVSVQDEYRQPLMHGHSYHTKTWVHNNVL